tara:strand:+ start:5666 stop:6175 length:510 start_codon:yes stop_codon:yes gene_type:complete
MNKLILPLIIIFAAMTRLIPHPPNFTPIIAIGLFSGYYVKNRSFAILLPILAMFFSDLFLGSHKTIYWVYGSLILVTFLGMLLVQKVNVRNYLISSISGACIFFLITNFGVWVTSSYYPKTLEGIIVCYTMALPFFGNTMISSLLYTGILFSIYEFYRSYHSKIISNSI